MRKLIVKTVVVLVGIYLVLAGALYLFQDQLIYQRVPLETNSVFHFDQPFEEFNIPVTENIHLNALLFRADSSAKKLIIYFHGNRDNLQRWGNYAEDFTSIGYDILMIDYRGYGKSDGDPSEEALYHDSKLVWDWAQQNLPHEAYLLYGRSLGSAVAAELATRVNPSLLLLETPFDELRGTPYTGVREWLGLFGSKHRFPNLEFIPRIKCRIVVFHGTDDWVVPMSSAAALKPLLKKEDEFYTVQGASHNNLRDFKAYHDALRSALVP